MRFRVVTYLLSALIIFLPNISVAGYILKIKNNTMLATLGDLDSDFVAKGDLFSIANKEGYIVGRAKVLKFNKSKAVLKFVGEAQKGYKITLKDYAISTNTSSTRQPAMSNVSFDNDTYNTYKKSITNVSRAQYIAGGVLGTLMGIGIGHAIQGRYMENGWLFTATQLGSAFSLGVFAGQGNEVWTGLSAITLIGFRIWELIDVWWLPSSHKIVSHKKRNGFYASPLLYSDNNSSQKALGLSLGFRW